mmetsp:Transcript_12616/g.29004  ORF Transcript_12616/g.29004 Transcript_12616/m.29004 type:complete len:241 (+) Transcript_12616:937-1659(+)
MTCRPPSSSTSSFSFLHRTSYSSLTSLYASRSCSKWLPASTGPVSAAMARRDSTSSMLGSDPSAFADASTASSIFFTASSESSGRGMQAGFCLISMASLDGRPFFLSTRAGANFCMMRFLAKNPLLPPRRMSVPLPAMLVAMVMAKARPACATISFSRVTTSGLALRTSCGTWSSVINFDSCSDAAIDVVPMRIGCPLVCLRAMSPITAFHLPACVRKVTSGLSRRETGRAVGMDMTSSP